MYSQYNELRISRTVQYWKIFPDLHTTPPSLNGVDGGELTDLPRPQDTAIAESTEFWTDSWGSTMGGRPLCGGWVGEDGASSRCGFRMSTATLKNLASLSTTRYGPG